MIRYIILLLSIFLFISCSGKHEERMAELDSIYGVCDNPARNYDKGTKKYELCKDKERAKGESLFGLSGDLSDIISGGDDKIIYQSNVNPYLWNAALEVTQIYPLKIADNQGGFIETDWIYETNSPSQRCLLKIHVLSRDLVTTGVTSSFLCENREDQVWVSDKKEYIEEEKQITLKILEIAGNLSKTSS
tara:strand:+ start:773 stop:1342 length:570 start_codon:yes stop_codon:yes gene_type:complete